MQENTNDTPDIQQSDTVTNIPEPQKAPIAPTVPQQPETSLANEQPQVTATTFTVPSPTPSNVPMGIYPEATKGFIGGSVQSEPIASAGEQTEVVGGGDMLFYVTAFTISLSLILGIVANIAGLLEIAFNQIGSDSESSASSYFGFDSYELKTMLWLVSSLIISTAVYILLLLYIQKKNEVKLNSFATKIYGFVYGGFLTILGLATVSSFGNFVYSCLVPLVPKGSYDSNTGPAWEGIVQALLTTILLGLVLFYYAKKAKTSDRLS